MRLKLGILVNDNKVVTFTSETEQLVNTSLDANPNHHKLNDLIVHSVFKRLYSRQGWESFNLRPKRTKRILNIS